MSVFEKIAGTTVGSFSIGVTAVASTGAIRLANATSVIARNQAGSGDLALVGTDSSNNVLLGDSNSNSLIPGCASFAWPQGTTSPGITQTAAASGATPQNLTFTPQTFNAGSTTTVANTPGSLVIALSAPGANTNAGNEAAFQIKRGANIITQFGVIGAQASFWMSSSVTVGFTPSSSNYSFTAFGNDLVLNGQTAGGVDLAVAGTINFRVAAGNVTLFNSQTALSGGGVKILGIANATTEPTTNPSGGSIWWSSLTVGASKQRTSSGWLKTTAGNTATAVNTQLLKYDELIATGQITSAGGTLTLSVPLPTSTSSVMIDCEVQSKITTAGTLTVVGDTFVNRQTVCYKNVAGTVSVVGSAATILNASDTHLSTSTVAFSVSTTNVVITLTINPTSGTQPGADCTILARCFYN